MQQPPSRRRPGEALWQYRGVEPAWQAQAMVFSDGPDVAMETFESAEPSAKAEHVATATMITALRGASTWQRPPRL